jgi:hypothetical protein
MTTFWLLTFSVVYLAGKLTCSRLCIALRSHLSLQLEVDLFGIA